MDVVTIETLTDAGYKDPYAVFTALALAGGFGDIKASQPLDIGGVNDADAKKAVADVLAKAEKATKGMVKTNGNDS